MNLGFDPSCERTYIPLALAWTLHPTVYLCTECWIWMICKITSPSIQPQKDDIWVFSNIYMNQRRSCWHHSWKLQHWCITLPHQDFDSKRDQKSEAEQRCKGNILTNWIESNDVWKIHTVLRLQTKGIWRATNDYWKLDTRNMTRDAIKSLFH